MKKYIITTISGDHIEIKGLGYSIKDGLLSIKEYEDHDVIKYLARYNWDNIIGIKEVG